MAEKTRRLYTGKDTEMIIAISTITDSAIADNDHLALKRPSWANPFFQNLQVRIDAVVGQYLGQSNARALRSATNEVLDMAGRALIDLAEAKVQLEQDYRKDPGRRRELLNNLGFTTYYPAARRGDQEALVSLLYQYTQNLDPGTEAEIMAKGTSPQLINNIRYYPDLFSKANIRQEGSKGQRPQDTERAVAAFNSIYEEVIAIANITKTFFKGQKTRADRYSYAKVLTALNTKPGKEERSAPKPPQA